MSEGQCHLSHVWFSPTSGDPTGPVYPICAHRSPNTPFIHSFIHASSFPEISVVLLIREIIHTLITKLNMSMATSRHNLKWMKMYLPSRTWEKYWVMSGVFEILSLNDLLKLHVNSGKRGKFRCFAVKSALSNLRMLYIYRPSVDVSFVSCDTWTTSSYRPPVDVSCDTWTTSRYVL